MSFPSGLNSISFSEVSGTRFTQTRISMLTSLCCFGVLPRNLLLREFRQINGGHLSFQARHLDRILNVHHAEGTCRHDHVRSRLGCHLDPFDSHPLLFFRLVEEHEPAATAAEGTVSRAA